MFHVIEFTLLKEVAVAPSNWLSETANICLWPPVKGPSILNRMVKMRVTPEKNWEAFQMRSLGAYNTYEEARKKLRRAEETSDLQSDVEEKRKRKRKHFSDSEISSSDEESQSLLPKAPVLPSIIQPSNSQPHMTPTFSSPSTSHQHDTPQTLISQRKQNRSLTYIKSPQLHTSSPQLSLNTQYLEQPLTPQQHKTTSNTQNSQGCSCQTLNSQILKSIQKELQAHTHILETHTKMLSQIHNQQFNHIPHSSNTITTSRSIPEEFPSNLPLQNLQELRAVEDFLKDDLNFSQTVSYFVSFGGNGKKNVLQRLLPQLIGQDLSLKLNWKGRGDKHGFQPYSRIHGLIYQAAKFHVKEEMSLADVEKFIKDWLRFAADRNGMRKFRHQIDVNQGSHNP